MHHKLLHDLRLQIAIAVIFAQKWLSTFSVHVQFCLISLICSEYFVNDWRLKSNIIKALKYMSIKFLRAIIKHLYFCQHKPKINIKKGNRLCIKFTIAFCFATYLWKSFSYWFCSSFLTRLLLIFWRCSIESFILNFQSVNYLIVQACIYWISRNYIVPLVTTQAVHVFN